MTKLAALLIASTALTAATQSFADAYEDSPEAPFYWTETSVEEKAPKPAPAPAPAAEKPGVKPAPKPAPKAPSENPMMEAYPVTDAPNHAVPEATAPRYLDNDCYPSETMPPVGLITTSEIADGDGDPRSATLRRRGEMAADDGVLEGIQDNPCAYIHRRGGETADSAREYTHPDDIRRVNVLEDRRIPVHDVGRYSPEGEAADLWHRDPSNPFIDASRAWTVKKGAMLSEVLIAWGEEAGFDVVWRSPHDFVLRADVTLRGTFPEVSGEVLESFANANPPIAGELYMANRVLVVDSASSFDAR